MSVVRHLFWILLGLLFFSGDYQKEADLVPQDLFAHFAFAINPSANSGLITYAIVETNQDNKIIGRTVISRNNWILQMRGLQKSKANISERDLITEYGVGDCFWLLDFANSAYDSLNCEAKNNIDDLWRLRYNRNPEYRQSKITSDLNIIGGWAANPFRPNWPQIQILQNYGIIYITDFFYGDNMFQLLKDIQDQTWLEKYKSAG
ncbi:hypothetical protein OAW23_07940 [Flavobacteriales bacterium]|nr:hypothetical protein [Flavobacteriales bacterium]